MAFNITLAVTLPLSLAFYIHCVRSTHGLDAPKQITLSDHCFGFKLMHYFYRPDALPAAKPLLVLRGIALLPDFPSSGFG